MEPARLLVPSLTMAVKPVQCVRDDWLALDMQAKEEHIDRDLSSCFHLDKLNSPVAGSPGQARIIINPSPLGSGEGSSQQATEPS